MRLEFQNICASYGKQPVLQQVSFTVPEGSITALTGRNGAGKTTLLSCLVGQKEYTGQILLDGQPIKMLHRQERAWRIAYLPQQLPCPHVTVQELVSFGRTPYTPLSGKLTPKDKQQIQWAIGAAGLTDLQNQFVDRLSGGEQKKAFFAMTLAQDAPIVVLDEPVAHLDAASRFAFYELIDQMRKQTGKSFLIVAHELTELLRYADKILVVDDKTVAFDGTGEACLCTGVPERYFGIRITGDKENGYGAIPL